MIRLLMWTSKLLRIVTVLPMVFGLAIDAAWAVPVEATLTVAVAANVRPAYEELKAEFTATTGIATRDVIGSSGKIAAQVRAGAPYDVFLAADTDYPLALYRDGLAATAPRVYAHGTLVVWTMQDLDVGRGLALLADGAIARVAVPNPELAPYGREALRALDRQGLRTLVEPKLVLAESVAQATQFIEAGAVAAGFTAKSMVLSPELAGKGRWFEVPEDLHQPIAQAAVVLRHGWDQNRAAAEGFLAFLFGDRARGILARYGYRLAAP
jgi:molybdate transport system substrate-binding protein